MTCSRISPNGKHLVPTTNLGSGLSKRSNTEGEEGENETVGIDERPKDRGERPEGRKAAKSKLKEKVNNTIINLVKKQMNSMASGTNVVGNAFLKFIDQASKI